MVCLEGIWFRCFFFLCVFLSLEGEGRRVGVGLWFSFWWRCWGGVGSV